MFGNFITYIIALLILATYQPADGTNFTPGETLALFFGILFFFFAVSRFLFRRIENRIGLENPKLLDRRFTATQLRMQVLGVAAFALEIYALNVTDFLSMLPFLGKVPTFQAVICMALFTGHLVIVWSASHGAYSRLYASRLGRGAYVFSNISFAVPVLLPWVILSAITDIIYALPVEPVKRFLSSPGGEFTYVLLFLGAIAVMGPAMIQKFWRCKPLPRGPARSRIEAICRSANVSYRDIVEWPVFGGHMITAGVMGLVKRFRYILVTRALLTHLSPEELDAVVAHEIGHVKKNHLFFYLFFLTGYMIVSYAAFDIVFYLVLYSKPAYRLISYLGCDPVSAAPFLLSLVMIVFFLVYFRYIFGYFMRNFERQADTYAFSMFGTARPLISTFQKIAFSSGQSPDKPNWHHFSIRQRIGFLERCEADGRLVAGHNRRVRQSIAIFLAAIAVIGFSGYHLNFGTTGERISSHLMEEILHREIEKDPHNDQLFSLLGDLWYSRKQFRSAIDAYERALAISFDTPHALNNLAWLYATCEDEVLRNPQRALFLAERAAELEPSPETLDTLAESYFINGEYDRAIEAETAAIELVDGNREYYEGQLEKFERAG